MAGTTLVRTTLTGVRPLGVRGEPLHHGRGHGQVGVVGRQVALAPQVLEGVDREPHLQRVAGPGHPV